MRDVRETKILVVVYLKTRNKTYTQNIIIYENMNYVHGRVVSGSDICSIIGL